MTHPPREERLIGMCSHPDGERMWWPAQNTDEPCVMDCDCKPEFWVPASLQAELDALRAGLLKATRYQVLDHGEQPEVRLRYETEAQADAVAALLNKETDR